MKTAIVGYARSKLSLERFYQRIGQHVKLRDQSENDLFKQFLLHNYYHAGSYDNDEDFRKLMHRVRELEQSEHEQANRLFYLALPPNIFETATELINRHCWETKLEFEFFLLDFFLTHIHLPFFPSSTSARTSLSLSLFDSEEDGDVSSSKNRSEKILIPHKNFPNICKNFLQRMRSIESIII